MSFATVVFSILAARYLPLLRWVFKFLYLSLGCELDCLIIIRPPLTRALVTVVAEVAGRLVLSQGLAGSFRPRKYFTIPREALEATLEDLQQLLDFFLIEFQRVLFAENIIHTVAVWFDIGYKLGSSPANTDLSIGFLRRLHCLLADQGPALLGAVSDRRHHCLPRSLFLHAQS